MLTLALDVDGVILDPDRDVEVDDVLDCRFESDFLVRPTAVELANRSRRIPQ